MYMLHTLYIATHIVRGIPSFPKQRRRCWMWKLCKIQGWLHLFEKQSCKPTRSLQSDANIAGCVVLHAEGYTRWAEHSVFQPQSLIMLEFLEGLTVKKGGNSLETVRLNSSSMDQYVLLRVCVPMCVSAWTYINNFTWRRRCKLPRRPLFVVLVFPVENRKEQEWISSAVQMVISLCPGARELITLTIYKVASVTGVRNRTSGEE